MTPTTLVAHTMLNKRAKAVIYACLWKIPTDKITLINVARLTSKQLMARRNCGEQTVGTIKDVLRHVGLFLADDTLELWQPDRRILTELFEAKANEQLSHVIQHLCSALTLHQLVDVAKRAFPDVKDIYSYGQDNSKTEDRKQDSDTHYEALGDRCGKESIPCEASETDSRQERTREVPEDQDSSDGEGSGQADGD